jgi:putative effector of murein hydrolase LrgA (UPF0299 family)
MIQYRGYTMFLSAISWIMESKLKIGAGAASGVGILTLIFNLNTSVLKKVEKHEAQLKEHVQLVLRPVQIQIKNLREEQKETKKLIMDIHNYLLESKK